MKRQLARGGRHREQARAADVRQHARGAGAVGRAADAGREVFNAVIQANTDDTLQAVQDDEAPKLAAHSDAIYLNAKLFQRVKACTTGVTGWGWTPSSCGSGDDYYLAVRARGRAAVGDGQGHVARPQPGGVHAVHRVPATSCWQGPRRARGGGRQRAAGRPERRKWPRRRTRPSSAASRASGCMPLQNTTQQPALASLTDRALRQRLFEASWTRTEHGDSNDTRAMIARLAQVRAERAKLLGFPTTPPTASTDQMAKTPDAAIELLTSWCRRRWPRRRTRRRRHAGADRQAGRRLQAEALGLGASTRNRSARRSTTSTNRRSGRISS